MCRNPIPADQLEIKTCAQCGADLSRWIQKPAASKPLVSVEEPPSSSFPRQAAILSFAAPFFSIVLNAALHSQVSGNHLAMLALGLTSIAIIVGGFILGIVALISMRRYGREGVLGRALAGTCINGLLILLMLVTLANILNYVHSVKAKEPQQTEQHAEQ